jgi:hypothetical protein
MAGPNDASAFLTVDALMEPWRQGDIADVRAFEHFADLRRPITTAAMRLSESADLSGSTVVRIGTEVEGLVVLTQTCDLQRSAALRPYVELCPLIRVDPETARAASARERPRFASIPAVGADAVADLDRVMTVEKGWLTYASRIPGWTTDDEIRSFQAAVARRYQRFAFPDDFVESMGRLRDRIVRRHGSPASPEGQLLTIVREIRVVASPDWSANNIEVTLFFILPGGTLSPVPDELIDAQRQRETYGWLAARVRRPPEVAERLLAEPDPASRSILWKRLADAWAEICQPNGYVSAIYAEAVDAREYCVEDYWQGVQLDLDYLSEPTLSTARLEAVPQDEASSLQEESSTVEREQLRPNRLQRLRAIFGSRR